MIGRLTGRLVAKQPPQILVDVGGVAYEVDVPMSTLYGLPAVGEPVTLHTHLSIKEDAHTLYGFATLEERSAFRQLIRISGVGPRTALAVLSGLSVSDLATAVSLQGARSRLRARRRRRWHSRPPARLRVVPAGSRVPRLPGPPSPPRRSRPSRAASAWLR